MLQLSERQLHTLLGIMIAASVAIGIFWGWQHGSISIISGNFSVLQNVSEGWVATYETLDAEKLQQFRHDDVETTKGVVTEVVNLPNDFNAIGKVSLSQKVPNMNEEKIFLVFRTNGEHVRVLVNDDELYDNEGIPYDFSYHVIPVSYEYRNGDLTFELEKDGEVVHFDEVKMGNFNELVGEALVENGFFLFFGILIIFAGVVLLIIRSFIKIKTDKKDKQLLAYSSLEGIAVGLLFVLESRLIRVLIDWEYICYYLQACLVVIIAVLHLFVIRCQIRKKRILTAVDFGIIFFFVMFVSAMVIQWFSLAAFDMIYRVELALFGVSAVIYTLILGTASYDYKQSEGKPVFAANILLIIASVIEIVLSLTNADNSTGGSALAFGVLVYFLILWIYGLKKSVYYEEKKEDGVDERKIRERTVEQFNPNLLFASFQTLQNLIKSDSKQSVKMIYYISVYVKNNLRAMSAQGEIIAFEEELEHMISYLQLQKVRNGNLGFALECKTQNFKVPRNTIEPIVENAVQYGVAGKNNRGNVVVRSYEREDGYAIQIIDDGIGFDAVHLKNHSSTSLKNLLNILEEKCRAKCEIISKQGKGTVVTIVLPVIDNDLLS